MARRSREHRNDIPGYEDNRPTRDDRRQQHRATRHATHQLLHAIDDPEEIVLPEERRTAKKTPEAVSPSTPGNPRRFKVWKTKFWKRRDSYQAEKAEIDSRWPVITPDQLPDS